MNFRSAVTLTAVLLMAAGFPAVSAQSGRVAETASEICPALPGANVPDVTLRAVDGSPLALRQLISRQPAVVIFYRGGW